MDETNPGPKVHTFLPFHMVHRNEKIILNKLQGLVRNIKWSPSDVSDLFDALLNRFESFANERSDLIPWMVQMLHCIEVNCISSTWRSKSENTLIELVRETRMKDENLKKLLADDADKTLTQIIGEIRSEKLNQVNDELLKEVRDIVSSVDQELTSKGNGQQLSGLKKDLLKLCQTAEKTHFRPRLTQMVSWCLMALSNTGRLIQVGTGEGKSCIVAMFAAYRAMKGDKVDIMSSSSVLAERDMEDWEEFYATLNISVDCNVNKQDEDLKKCYKSQVVYGTVEQFAGDWLRQHFHRMDIFSQRTFQCAILDEVDSLMLDKGHNTVYLSSDMPALQHLNPLLAFIWATSNQYNKIGANKYVGQKYLFPQVVLKHIKEKGIEEYAILQIAEDTGVLSKGSVQEIQRDPKRLMEKTASVATDKLVDFLRTIEKRFPSCQFALYTNRNGVLEKLNRKSQEECEQKPVSLLLDGGFCQYMYHDKDSVLRAAKEEIKHALHFTPCELKKTGDCCYVPGFLYDLVKSKLQVWIENAFLAQSMEDEHEYIQEQHRIVPVDYSCTGVVENFMEWSDGLQQFLEMKHQSKMSDMTAITNYMSNVGLLQLYKSQIYGMSGTLGQQPEIETLQKIYTNIQTCQIPSFKRRKLFEVEGAVVIDEMTWIKNICDAVVEQIQETSYRGARAVLIICETIKLAKVLHQALEIKVPNKTLYINNNMDNSAIVTNKLGAGEVIIATNLAGRGTDLQVSDSVKTAGGLFVVQTFLPKDARVEAQAFGRAARQGSPGSAQLIVCSQHLRDAEPLQLLVLTRKFLSLMENMLDDSSSFQDLFVMKLRLYQKSFTNKQRKEISSLLSHILTEESTSDIMLAKKIRDESEAGRLSRYVDHHIPNIKKKEELFNQYLEILNHLYKSNSNKPAASDVSALNEFWGIWLLTKFNEEESITTLKNSLNEDLSKAIQKLRLREPPLPNLHHYTLFGNELREKGMLSESINMYTKAIDDDPCWAAIAYYNRAFANLTQLNKLFDPECINEILKDLQKSLKSVEFYCDQLDITYRCIAQQNSGSNRNSTTRFYKHIKVRRIVQVAFKANIFEAIQKVDRAKDLGCPVRFQKKQVYFLFPPEHFMPLPVLFMELEREIYSRGPQMIHNLVSHPSFDTFIELVHLESMGLIHIYAQDTLISLGFFSKSLHKAFLGFLKQIY
ncbi:protein translocase subunit SecA-like [Nematolebias whitei]|uniref:protein translocase subunit SecA-like n=1 Tax=Nematolebias whitei TaxID=451745 RepID=UPI00189882EC|nr:protein translocase subunit SecA-like [Nematolebias whitei]